MNLLGTTKKERNQKAFLIASILLTLGVYISKEQNNFALIVTAILTIIVVIRLVGVAVNKAEDEIFITGSLLGLINAYTVYLQTEIAWLPKLTGNPSLFLGIAGITRLIILILQRIPNKYQKSINNFFRVGK